MQKSKNKIMIPAKVILSIACCVEILSSSCNSIEQKKAVVVESKIKTIREKSDELGFNPETDSIINSLLDSKVIIKERELITLNNSVQYMFYYEYAMIGVVHYLYKPYSQKDHWTFGALRKDGVDLMIESSAGLPLHKISGKTYNRLKSMCK